MASEICDIILCLFCSRSTLQHTFPQAARDSAYLLQQGEEHMREKMHIQLGLQKHRELAEQAEVATHDRIRQLQMRRIREDVSVLLCIFVLNLLKSYPNVLLVCVCSSSTDLKWCCETFLQCLTY